MVYYILYLIIIVLGRRVRYFITIDIIGRIRLRKGYFLTIDIFKKVYKYKTPPLFLFSLGNKGGGIF